MYPILHIFLTDMDDLRTNVSNGRFNTSTVTFTCTHIAPPAYVNIIFILLYPVRCDISAARPLKRIDTEQEGLTHFLFIFNFFIKGKLISETLKMSPLLYYTRTISERDRKRCTFEFYTAGSWR